MIESTAKQKKKILQRHKPQILFLCETKMEAGLMRQKGTELMFENCFVVGRNGMGCGLALLWHYDTTVNITSCSKHHIDAVVHTDSASYWRCTGIWAP